MCRTAAQEPQQHRSLCTSGKKANPHCRATGPGPQDPPDRGRWTVFTRQKQLLPCTPTAVRASGKTSFSVQGCAASAPIQSPAAGQLRGRQLSVCILRGCKRRGTDSRIYGSLQLLDREQAALPHSWSPCRRGEGSPPDGTPWNAIPACIVILGHVLAQQAGTGGHTASVAFVHVGRESGIDSCCRSQKGRARKVHTTHHCDPRQTGKACKLLHHLVP